MSSNQSDIHLTVGLDDDFVPESIEWEASDKKKDGPSPTKAISLAVWDDKAMNTMRIDLWTKDMPVDQMKRFHIDCIGGLAQTILTSTGDEYMSNKINKLCDQLVDHLKEEIDSGAS